MPFDKEEETSIIPYDSLNGTLKNDKGYQSNLYPFTDLKETIIDDFKIRFAFYNKRFYFVVKDVYVKLNVRRPSTSAGMFHLNHKDKFLPDSFAKLEFYTPGGKQLLLVATFDVVSWICSRANSELGYRFQQAVGKLHQKLIEGEISLVPSQEAIYSFLHEQKFKTSLLEKQLVQVTSSLKHNTIVLEQLIASVNQFQIDRKIETAISSGPISKKQEETIRFLINDTAINGIHFNTIYSQFKRKFKIYYIENLLKTDYKKAIIWFNKYQDQIKKRETKKPKLAKLDNWLESSFPQGNTKRGIDA